MAFDIACPQCEHHYVGIDPRLIGQSFTCACGAEVHITEKTLKPAAEDIAQLAQSANQPTEADRDDAMPSPDQPVAESEPGPPTPTPTPTSTSTDVFAPPANQPVVAQAATPVRPPHITVVCPSCKHEFIGMDPSLAGQTFNCICGQQLHIDEVPVELIRMEKPKSPAQPAAASSPPAVAGNAAATPTSQPASRIQAKHEAVATGMLQVVCPTCEHLYHSIPEEFAGRRFICQTCDTRIAIPTRQQQADATAAKAEAAARKGDNAAKLDYLSLATYEEEDEAVHNRSPDDHTPPAFSAFDYEDVDPEETPQSNHLLVALILIAVLVLLMLVLSTYVVVMLAGGE